MSTIEREGEIQIVTNNFTHLFPLAKRSHLAKSQGLPEASTPFTTKAEKLMFRCLLQFTKFMRKREVPEWFKEMSSKRFEGRILSEFNRNEKEFLNKSYKWREMCDYYNGRILRAKASDNPPTHLTEKLHGVEKAMELSELHFKDENHFKRHAKDYSAGMAVNLNKGATKSSRDRYDRQQNKDRSPKRVATGPAERPSRPSAEANGEYSAHDTFPMTLPHGAGVEINHGKKRRKVCAKACPCCNMQLGRWPKHGNGCRFRTWRKDHAKEIKKARKFGENSLLDTAIRLFGEKEEEE